MAYASSTHVSMSCIDPMALARADEFASRFSTARPFRHVVIPGFLDGALCQNLLGEFPSFENRHALNEMGEVGGKAVRMDVRDISDSYRRLDAYLQTPEFLGFVSRVTGIPDLLYDPDYIGGGTHENREGQGLDAHVDFNYHPRRRLHRRLNLIVYLNPRWEAEWGGALELHSDPWNEASDEVVGITPFFNTCAIFETTESSWHGFSQIRPPEGEAHPLQPRMRRELPAAAPHAAVERHQELHVVTAAREIARERRGDVGEASGLGEGFGLGGDEQDPHPRRKLARRARRHQRA